MEAKLKMIISKSVISDISIIVLIAIVGMLLFNQMQIGDMSDAISNIKISGATTKTATTTTKSLSGNDLDSVDLSSIKGTGYAIAALFPVEDIETAQDALDMIIPTGTPDYGDELGVSYDDPVTGLSTLVSTYKSVQLSGEDQERYVALVTKPVGISCEYCCGLGAVGADAQGNSKCGCQHNPALLGLTKWLIANTDYSDAEIVKEALKWKALFFPKKMVELTASLVGGDTGALDALPGMVGGC